MSASTSSALPIDHVSLLSTPPNGPGGPAAASKLVHHEQGLMNKLASHYCDPDVSDVVLQVGVKQFPAHRFVLAMQSPVFRTMLLGNNWKEAGENRIQLEELDHCEAVFGDFLKFFYVGNIELTYQNVCSLHTLADKYDVASLNRDCVSFMKCVLSASLGKEVLKTTLLWIPYIDRCIPQLLPTCYKAIQSNFGGLYDDWIDLNALTVDHMAAILGDENSDGIVVYSEYHLYAIVQKWVRQTNVTLAARSASLQLLLPYIHFYNMDTNEIKEIKEENLEDKHADLIMKDYLTHAYKIQADMFQFSVRAPKKRKLSGGGVEHRCPCKSSRQCQHVNPRLYLRSPFGKKIKLRLGQSDKCHLCFEVVDLKSLKTYMNIYAEHADKSKRWEIHWSSKTKEADNTVQDKFIICPAECHVGRRYTLVIAMKYSDRHQEIHYTIINTDKVSTRPGGFPGSIIVQSPRRYKNAYEMKEFARLYVAVYLHGEVQWQV